MEGTVWRNRADPLNLIRISEDHPPDVVIGTHLPERPGGKGSTEVLSKGELRKDWEQTSIEDWEAALLKFAPPERDDSVPPDLVGAIFGFRAWQLDAAGYLSSQGVGNMTWEAGRNVAVCAADFADGHRAPIANCACGLYAYHDPDNVELVRFPGEAFPIAGVVRAWGDIEVHHSGFRAEYAEIVALCVPAPEITASRQAKHPLLDALKRAEDRYGAEIILSTPQAMREWVTEQKDGDVIPPEMRPELKRVIREVFWAPPVTMDEQGFLRVGDQMRTRAERYEIQILSEGERAEPRDGRVMYVGEARYPGSTEKQPAVAYLKLSRQGRLFLKHDREINVGMTIFYVAILLWYVSNVVRGLFSGDWLSVAMSVVFGALWVRLTLWWIDRARGRA